MRLHRQQQQQVGKGLRHPVRNSTRPLSDAPFFYPDPTLPFLRFTTALPLS